MDQTLTGPHPRGHAPASPISLNLLLPPSNPDLSLCWRSSIAPPTRLEPAPASWGCGEPHIQLLGKHMPAAPPLPTRKARAEPWAGDQAECAVERVPSPASRDSSMVLGRRVQSWHATSERLPTPDLLSSNPSSSLHISKFNCTRRGLCAETTASSLFPWLTEFLGGSFVGVERTVVQSVTSRSHTSLCKWQQLRSALTDSLLNTSMQVHY